MLKHIKGVKRRSNTFKGCNAMFVKGVERVKQYKGHTTDTLYAPHVVGIARKLNTYSNQRMLTVP